MRKIEGINEIRRARQCFLMSNDISFIPSNIFHEQVNDVMSHEFVKSIVEGKEGGVGEGKGSGNVENKVVWDFEACLRRKHGKTNLFLVFYQTGNGKTTETIIFCYVLPMSWDMWVSESRGNLNLHQDILLHYGCQLYKDTFQFNYITYNFIVSQICRKCMQKEVFVKFFLRCCVLCVKMWAFLTFFFILPRTRTFSFYLD